MTKTNLITQVVRLFAPVMLMCTSTLVCAEDVPLIALFTETDTTYYADFVSALKEANKREKATMQLWDDVRFGGPAAAQTVKTNLCIDLNGYSLGDTLSGTSLLTLNTDTLTLRVTSSRPGGRIWAARAYNGKFSVLNITKGTLETSHVLIEAHNTLPYDASSAKSVAASCVTMAAPTSLTMDDCRLVCEAEKSATAVSGAGNAGAAAEISIRNSTILSRGQTSIYGVNVYSKAQIEDCRIEAEGTENTVYGVNVNLYRDTAQGIDYEASIKGAQVRVTGESKIYGVYAKGGIVLHNDSIDVQGKTTVCGVHGDKNLQAEGCVIGVKADSTSAEGVDVAAASKAVVRHCHITADATEGKASGFAAAGNAGAAADVTFAHNEVRVQGVSSVYGVNVYSKAQIEDCRIEAEGTESTVYGVNVNLYRDTAQGIEYEASIKGVQVRVTGGSTIYGVYSKGSIVMEQDTVSVRTHGTTAYGIHGLNGLQATGCQVEAEALRDDTLKNLYGINAGGEVSLEHCDISARAGSDKAEETFKSTVYGVALSNSSHATMSGCHVHVLSSGAATAVSGAGNASTAADVTINDNRIEAYGAATVHGVNCYSRAAIEQCRITARSGLSNANGVNINIFQDCIHGEYEAIANRLTIDVRAHDKAYGIQSKGPLEMAQDTIHVEADSVTAYGVNATFSLRASACEIEVHGQKTVYGVYSRSRMKMTESTIACEATHSQAWAFYLYSGEAEVSDCHAEVRSGTQQAYSVYALNGCTGAVFTDVC
ncbi:MAG: hypothetical protein IKO26_09625 [Paludibacteraceae bacterium]|nr:hypothetical protein [Paludibacteraceae bacterium]